MSEFRATRTEAPDLVSGIAVEFVTDDLREDFLRRAEAEFSAKRFMNAADAFDTVKAWALANAPQST